MHSALKSRPNRAHAPGRWWFAGIGVFYILVAILGFAPQSIAHIHNGDRVPIELHVHAAIMGMLLALFVLQSVLVQRGNVALHKRLGVFGVALGTAALVSMALVVDSAMRREDVSALPFLPNVLTLGIVQIATFSVLFGTAVAARRAPPWHKRLMTFALLSTLQAATQRMQWLPDLPLPPPFNTGVWLYAFALPIILFDVKTIGRPHPATLFGLLVITVMETILALAWDNPGYHDAFINAWRLLYRP